ncbi:acidic leucine-rich nuclear phosphoprotein 32 family member A [Tanacetum coccineum]
MQTDTGRMKATRLTTDVRLGQLLWLYLTTVLKSTLDILAYSEKSPDNVETNFPAVAGKSPSEVNHVLDDDDDVVVSDDDEVNPSTNVEEMACVFPRSHGGDAGGSPPRRPNRPVPAQCESSNLRIETGNASLRRAFRQNDQRPLTIGFDYGDLGTFHPTGDYSSMLNSLMGETVKYLPLACEWEEIPEAYKAHIFPTLESYFDLASWYNNQDKVVMGNNVYTVGDRVKLGLQLKLRILWRKNKQRIKADNFTRYGSAEEARNHLPPKKVWGDKTEDEWNNLVDWWSHPDRVARSLQNAANRAKNTILTHQGKKSFAQGRNEYKVQKGHYEDLIETWRKTHSRPETGEFKTQKNLKRYLDMKSMQDQVRAGVIPYKTDQDILDEVVPSTNRQNMSGKGRKLPGGGSTSRRRGPQAFPDVISREEMDRILRQRDQEAELLRKQTAEAQQRAYLAALKADAAYQNSETMYGAIGDEANNAALVNNWHKIWLHDNNEYSSGEKEGGAPVNIRIWVGHSDDGSNGRWHRLVRDDMYDGGRHRLDVSLPLPYGGRDMEAVADSDPSSIGSNGVRPGAKCSSTSSLSSSSSSSINLAYVVSSSISILFPRPWDSQPVNHPSHHPHNLGYVLVHTWDSTVGETTGGSCGCMQHRLHRYPRPCDTGGVVAPTGTAPKYPPSGSESVVDGKVSNADNCRNYDVVNKK